ncbi:MAG: ribonuclease H family protein [Flavobacteriales bacterium]|nr:ribonuclease H family protein [Flavobacteriales bacterium]
MAQAKQAFADPDSVQASTKKKKKHYYVVWAGYTPGVYDDWDKAKDSMTGFKGPKYKTFGSKQLAERAFQEGPENFQGSYKKTRDLTPAEANKIGSPIEMSLSVDAACNGKGVMEYQGVWTFNEEHVVFRKGPYQGGSNNIGEFLALVHGLAHFKGQKDTKLHTMPIYSDSKIAMGWIKAKRCRTNQKPPPEVQNLIMRAERWLHNNAYQNPIYKWETKAWGEIPADFGRK